MTSAIERRMKAKNRSATGDVVDHWNHVCHHPVPPAPFAKAFDIVFLQSP